MGGKQSQQSDAGGAARQGAPCGGAVAKQPLTLPRTWQGWQLPPRYEVGKIIGKGSYGSVCQADDKVNGRKVAIKQLKHLFDDLVDCKRILRELAILVRLDSNHCVRVHDIFVPADDYIRFDEVYIVLEMCDTDMKKLVKTDVNLQPDMVTSLIYNLLVGLKYIHSAGIYHRDLKPANCLVNQNCEVKICDFGLARAMGGELGAAVDSMAMGSFQQEDSDEDGTSSMPVVPATLKKKRYLTQHVVTRWYRAPEIILLQTGYNEAIDIWSVGCIYAELLQMADTKLRLQDRGPLFPGNSCMPLSPERRSGSKKRHARDQMEMIFNILGTPSQEEINCLENEDAKKYVRGFSHRAASGFGAYFEHDPDPSALSLMKSMLRFSAKARVTVLQALGDQQLASVRDEATEHVAPGLVTLDFEDGQKMNQDQLKRCFKEEIEKFRVRHP